MTFVQSNAADDNSGTPVLTFGVTLTGVGAGNLIACATKHEGATSSITVSDGTTTLTAGTYQANPVPDAFGQWNYLLIANSGTKTYTSTFGATRPFPSSIALEFSYTGTASLDCAAGGVTANGTSTAPNSGNMTTAGTDGMAFGYYIENSGVPTTTELINGATRTGVVRPPIFSSSAWYLSYTAGFTGAASATLASSRAWSCCAIAFKAVSSASAPFPPFDQRPNLVRF